LTDLHGAIASRDASRACSIIDGDAQSADIGGALLLAAVEGSAALIDALVLHGAPIQFADKRGSTPAHIAAAAGNQSGLEALLRHGADAHAVGHLGATPLMLAVGAMSASCAELLLPVSDLNARDRAGDDTKNYAPAFHADPDDPGFENALRYARLLQSLEEASMLEAACSEAASAKPRSL
jgi:ankyrin repeat protein